MATISDYSWWQTGVIYEAYIRSFQDSNGDGVGDINGIRSRLDYLQWLGVDILWIPPFYKSPQVEFGYDIADYTSVDPLFGTMEELEQLISEAHSRNIRIVLDIAPNHTSDQHAWFQESTSDRASPKRDWYIWRDPGPDGGPPNNWVSAFGGGSAWEFDASTGQYYYHAFMKEQPDLNWRNPEVEGAFFDCLRFWLDKGIDGFRVDVMWHLIKDAKFRDNPPNPDYDPKSMPSNNVLREVYSADRPEVVDLVMRFRNVLQEYPDERLLIGELYQTGDQLLDYYGPDCNAAQMPHNQQLILLPWEAPKIRDAIERYEGSLPENCWPNWVIGNHDKPRLATRVKSQEQARVAMMMILTLRGTPHIYYGDELGMQNVEIPDDRVRDPFEKLDPGRGQGRDPQRTPMQWSATEANSGFSAGEPWLPMAKDWRDRNVEIQQSDPNSHLNLTRELLQLRRQERAILTGEHRLVITEASGPVIAYRRELDQNRLLVALNLSTEPVAVALPYGYEAVRTVMSTITKEPPPVEFRKQLVLRADEGIIVRPASIA